jgi:plasmid stabilization system protein ParE
MRIEIALGARWDLEEIHDDLEARERGLGKRLVRQFQAGLERIQQFPRRYARHLGSVRICRLTPFKIGVFYRVRRDRIDIAAVIDLRRSPAYIIRKLRSL